MPGFALLEKLIGGITGRRERRSNELYTFEQLRMLQNQEREYRNEYQSLSMSSTSSSAYRRHKRKIKVKPKESFTKE